MSQVRLHAVVHGLVQGVGFRAWTERTAKSINLCGWVRNMPDGSVEIVAEGEESCIQQFEKLLYKGPTYSKVLAVDAEYQTASGEFLEFLIST